MAETTDDPHLKVKVWLALLTYAYPRLKAVSVEAAEQPPDVILNVVAPKEAS